MKSLYLFAIFTKLKRPDYGKVKYNGIPTSVHYTGDFWQWNGNAYRKVEKGEVRKTLLHFLERAKVEYRSKDGIVSGYGAFPIVPSHVNAITELLKDSTFQLTSDTIPCWIDGESCKKPPSVIDPSLLIFCKSQILNLDDMGILPPSPRWLNLATLDCDYDPNTECPQWLDFLDSIFTDGDEESKQTLTTLLSAFCTLNLTLYSAVICFLCVLVI